ncbi:Fc receptor-like protein 5 [Hoplias malabaricus]|uniref:Fc receptor-like protein 5 n=1 Tax=Hoplias malabaricus TaxID=27720 RepID=UPI003463525E
MELSALSVTLWLIVVIHNGETVNESDLPTPSLTVEPKGDVFSGDSVTLKCKVTPEGDWTYLWERTGPGGSPAVFQSFTEKIDTQNFTVAAVDGDQYQCRVRKTGGTQSSLNSNTVTLTVEALPSPALTVKPEGDVFRGESVSLKCEIKGYSGWTYQWEKSKGSVWTTVSQSEYYTLNTDTLTIRKDYVRNGDQYRCRGQKTGRSLSSHYSEPVTLSVKARPTPTLTRTPERAVFTGESVTLKCEIKDYDGWTYRWEKQNSGGWTALSHSKYYTVNTREDFAAVIKYRCRGERQGRPDSSNHSNVLQLTVKARPTPTLTRTPEGAVFTGESVTLKCEIKDYDGWTYQWEEQNHGGWTVLSQSEYYTVNRDTLTITEDSAAVGNYRCRGKRQGRPDSSNYSDVLKLTVNALLTPALTVKPEGDVFSGDSVTLTCEIWIHGGWTYQWEKSKVSGWTTVSQSEYYTVNTDTLNIRKDYVSNRDQYRCRGQKTDRSLSSQYSEPVTLSVEALPTASLTAEPKGDVFRGQSVTLKCEIKGYSGWTYQWEKKVKDGDWRVYRSGYYALTITEYYTKEGDQYRCRGQIADRSLQSHYSEPVTVKAPPTPSLTVEPEGDVFSGDTVTLKCEIKDLLEWTYYWQKKNKLSSWSNLYQSWPYTDTLTIRSVTDGDQYRCRGWNSDRQIWSQDSETFTLTVKALPTPALTVEPEGDVFRGESVSLRCEIKGYSGWTYQWEKSKGSGWTAVSQSEYYTVNTDNLTIREDYVSNRDQYQCRGQKTDRSLSSHYSEPVTLSVKALPTPSLTVEPEGDVFRGESVSLKCEIKGYSGWTYQWEKSEGSGWTTVSQSEYYTVNTDNLTIGEDYISNRDQYRCRGQKTGRSLSSQYSETFTLSVKEKPKPELTSSRKGPALRGQPVVLFCELGQSAGWTFYWSKHTHNPENETCTETHSYTISSVSDSDGGQYWCRAGRGNPLYFTHYSDALWVNITALSLNVSLMVSPNRTQNFSTDSLTLSCEGQRDSTGWRVRQYTHGEVVSDCSLGIRPTCNISSLNTSHTGVYWCESESGESSNPLNVTVHNGSVILENPVHPVTEGDYRTLLCDTKPQVTQKNQTTAKTTNHTVSQSDEGASFSVLGVLSSLMAVTPYILVSIVLGVKCYRARAKPNDEDEEDRA